MFDTPVFKVLARNDTGQAPGHQGGIVVPAEIEDFFPDVVGTITQTTPTADVPVIADLIVDGRFVGRVNTRYQYQTWGGKRKRERRLTGGLGPLRNAANPNDMMLFSRDPEVPERMTISLVRNGSPEFEAIYRASGGQRWGIVSNLPRPVANSEIRRAENEIDALLNQSFSAFEPDRSVADTIVRRKARTAAFRKKLLGTYGPVCAASGELIVSKLGLFNLDAAHIVPVEFGGTDDIRNGLLLSKDLHWAFDQGLFSVSQGGSILLSGHAKASKSCEQLKRIEGRKLDFAAGKLRPHPDAINWHLQNRFIG